MKEIKLEVGQIWQKPNTLDVRTIDYMGYSMLSYFNIGGRDIMVKEKVFRQWIRRNSHAHQRHNVKLIGHYDFDKKKARAVK